MPFPVLQDAGARCKKTGISRSFSKRSYRAGRLDEPPWFISFSISGYILVLSGIVSICAAAWALYHAGVPLLPVIVLLGTVLTAYSHALPFGPLGSACFFVAALWIELVWRKSFSEEKHGGVGATQNEEILMANVSRNEQ